MSILRMRNPARTGNALDPRWTRGNKDAVGTAYSPSPVWFTLSAGVISEVYYPTLDTPQIRDLQFLVTDSKTFFHDGRRSYDVSYECIQSGVPGFRMTSRAKDQPYQLVQEIITTSLAPCLLVRTQLLALPSAPAGFLDSLHVYVLVSPHIDGKGGGNSGYVGQTRTGQILLARRGLTWLAVAATVPYLKCSVGYSGVNDGWQDIVGQRRLMMYDFDAAENGNIALTGELDISKNRDFVVGLAFGQDAASVADLTSDLAAYRSEAPGARLNLSEGIGEPFDKVKSRYIQDWQKELAGLPTPDPAIVGHQDRLYQISRNILLSHEDQIYDGAFIASMSIPWGEDTGDQDGGYHLVWPRDMSQTIGALVAAGIYDAPLRGLRFLAVCQQNNGALSQRFMVDGSPNGLQVQLDEIAFPVMQAFRLHRANKLAGFDPVPLVTGCASALILLGPKTSGERWEEQGGYSPSTLASNIAAMICAAVLVRELASNNTLANFYEEYADFLERHLEGWTTTRQGTVSTAGITHHYIRLSNLEDPESARVSGSNGQSDYAAKDMVDAGFLELVRYGIRRANDRLIVDSVKVVDQLLGVNFASVGTEPRICFHRYNHDGYGQKADGRSYKADPGGGTGLGGPWPLLAGERAHYELALGGNPGLYLRSFESFATQTGLFPEQVWYLPDNPSMHLVRGGPTGAAVPLVWAHAEYVKLVRSLEAGQLVDSIPEVAQRYVTRVPSPTDRVEFWTFQRKDDPVKVRRGQVIRIPVDRPFQFRWTNDSWQTVHDLQSSPSVADQIHAVNFDTTPLAGARIDFTFYWPFYWPTDAHWEGRNFSIDVQP